MSLNFRALEDSDALPIYRWQRDPSTRLYSGVVAVPTWQEHVDWFSDRMANPPSECLLVAETVDAVSTLFGGTDRSRPVGFAKVEMNLESSSAAISIVVSPVARGRGVGRKLINAVTSIGLIKFAVPIYATIHKENAPSLSAFARAGYVEVEEPEGQWRIFRITAGGGRSVGGNTSASAESK